MLNNFWLDTCEFILGWVDNIQGVCGALDEAVNVSGPSGDLDGTPTIPDGRDTTKTVETNLVYALTRERDTLRREQNKRSDATALLKEKDEIITQVMAEGEELSKKQAVQESTIRKLRAQIREIEEEKKGMINKLQIEENKVESLKRDKAATEKLLQEITDKKDAELATQKEHYMNALTAAKEAKARADSRANDEARTELESHLKEVEERETVLVQTLQELRKTLSRKEQQAVYREDMLRKVIEDLQRRYQESERKCEELVIQVPESTRPRWFYSEPGEMAPESSRVVVMPKFDMHTYTFTTTPGVEGCDHRILHSDGSASSFYSEPGEMAPESSRVVVMPKFDMHTYTFTLTSKELKDVITEYCILMDLHPRLPPSGLTMDKLPSRYIGIYIEQLEQGGLHISFLVFFLAVIKHFKQGHWFSFENKTGGRTKKCFKEITSSLKGWKKKFFLIDRIAVSDAMPWRYSDTDVQEDFPNNYNEKHAERLATPILRYAIKDSEGQVISMDDFLQLSEWNGTIVSKTKEHIPENQRPQPHVTLPLTEGEPILEKSPAQKAVEKPNSKIAAAREEKDKQSLEKAQTKHTGEESSVAPRKKRARKNQEAVNSGSDRTISITPLHHASPKPVDEIMTSAPRATTGIIAGESQTANLEKEVVDLSENTRILTPPVIFVVRHAPHVQPDPSPERVGLSDEGGSSAEHQFILEWGLQDYLWISSFRACKEMITHLATPAEGEYLGSLSNMDDHVDLLHRSDFQLEELNRLRNDLQMVMQTNDGLCKQLSLLDSVYSPSEDKERELADQLKEMEKERDDWRRTSSELSQTDSRVHFGGKTEEEIAAVLSKTRNLDIKGSKVWKDKHHEIFTKQYSYIQKVVESYRLPLDALLQVSPDPPTAEISPEPSAKVNTRNVATQVPPNA
ncbi:golgin candidate 5 [Tanacetum coccineum]|uniref:Golgin candidate 5 n=1 Tax=Tanacetum coccineum TaxID=301880 RepID=A0ABQ5D6D4_9ASTR